MVHRTIHTYLQFTWLSFLADKCVIANLITVAHCLEGQIITFCVLLNIFYKHTERCSEWSVQVVMIYIYIYIYIYIFLSHIPAVWFLRKLIKLYHNSLNHTKSHTKAFIIAPPTLYFTEMNIIVPWLILVTKLRNITFPVCSCFMHSVHRIQNKCRQCYLI